jgi:hypothetical protein
MTLENKTIDITKKYKTENGNEVELYEICNDKIFGKVKERDRWKLMEWDTDGKTLSYPTLDLVIIPDFEISHIVTLVNKLYKTVVYFGYCIDVPKYARYIATDSYGGIYWFINRPTATHNIWSNNDCTHGQSARHIVTVDFKGDWISSLKEI